MKTLRIPFIPLCIVFITTFLFSSCKKDEDKSPVNAAKLAEDISLGDQVYSDIFGTVNNESNAIANGDGSGKASACGIVTLTGAAGSWPTALSIDYGTGCTDDHGITRKGSIAVAYNGAYFTPGSSLTVATNNYYVNGYIVDGTLNIRNNGRNGNNNWEFEVTVQGGRIVKPDGSVVALESTRVFEWSEGEHLLSWCDNAWLVSGASEGITSDGHDYSVTITTPLKKRSCCAWISEGFIEVDVDGDPHASIDYGSGNCDRAALYTHDGMTETVLLP